MGLFRELYEQYEKIDKMIVDKGYYIDDITKEYYYSDYDYKIFNEWIQYLGIIVELYLGRDLHLIKKSITVFLDNLGSDRVFYKRSSVVSKEPKIEYVKPFLAQSVLLISKFDKNISWITDDYYEKLKKYIQCCLYYRDRYGQSFLTCESALHMGMDNYHKRAGDWKDCVCERVDYKCFFVRECEAMSAIAGLCHKSQDELYFKNCAEKLKTTILTLWDEEDEIFYDRNGKTGKLIKVKHIGALATMWANVATKEQVDIMMKRYIMNPKGFLGKILFSEYVTSKMGDQTTDCLNDLGYNWRAYAWIPSNYHIFQGMRNYGYFHEAERLAEISYQRVKKIGKRQHYTSDTCKGTGKGSALEWSLLAYFMPLESLSKYDPTKFNH